MVQLTQQLQMMPPVFQFIGPLVQARPFAGPLRHRWTRRSGSASPNT